MKKFAVLSAVIVLAACGEVSETETAAPAGPPVEVSSTELAKAYEENEVAAQGQYGGKVLKVSGRVVSIELDMMDEPVVALPGANEFSNVQASFGEDATAITSSLKKGQEITVTCNKVSEVMGSPILTECAM
jgi:hypothetical protein